MEENKKGFILSIADVEPHEHGAGSNPHYVQVYRFLRAVSEAHGGGKEPSKHITLALDKFQPGGGFSENFRECNTEAPVFDLVFYVISGRIRATVGDIEKTVGANTLIYCPSNVKHSMTVVGKSVAKILMIYGTGEGEKMGVPIYAKSI
jgi:mannose-6-phosphate isomerase-like protein (cupin superfamily)